MAHVKVILQQLQCPRGQLGGTNPFGSAWSSPRYSQWPPRMTVYAAIGGILLPLKKQSDTVSNGCHLASSKSRKLPLVPRPAIGRRSRVFCTFIGQFSRICCETGLFVRVSYRTRNAPAEGKFTRKVAHF